MGKTSTDGLTGPASKLTRQGELGATLLAQAALMLSSPPDSQTTPGHTSHVHSLAPRDPQVRQDPLASQDLQVPQVPLVPPDHQDHQEIQMLSHSVENKRKRHFINLYVMY